MSSSLDVFDDALLHECSLSSCPPGIMGSSGSIEITSKYVKVVETNLAEPEGWTTAAD